MRTYRSIAPFLLSATLLIGLVSLFVVSRPAHAAGVTYHVSTTGKDTNSCATAKSGDANAKRTINAALACAGPGDTVQVGPGRFNQRIDVNVSSLGSAAGGHITIQGTKPTGSTILDGAGLGNGWMIYGRHVKYIRIRNFEIMNHLGGGIGFFGHTERLDITDNYVHDNSFLEGQGSGIRVTTRYSPKTNKGQGIELGTAKYVTIARNRLKNITTGFTGNLPNSGTECLTVVGDISYFAILDNELESCQFIGIDLIGKTKEWMGMGGNQTMPIPDTPWPRKGIVRGNKVLNMRKGLGGGDAAIYCDGCREIVYDHNIVNGAFGYCYTFATEEDKFLIDQIIVRHNIGMGCPSSIYMIGPAPNIRNSHHGVSDHLRVVHNTALKTKGGGPAYRFFFTDGTIFKNNIGAIATTQSTAYTWHAENVAATSPLLDYNLYWGGKNFQYKGTVYTSFPAYQSGSGQDAHSLVADPKFTNANAGTFILQSSSSAIDKGTPLTYTVGSGSGTVVRVQDARYFTDGYGMVPGDAVQIGSHVARVTSVDYAGNRLTIDRSITWSSNQGVSYPFQGSAPDLGACEFGASGPLPETGQGEC